MTIAMRYSFVLIILLLFSCDKSDRLRERQAIPSEVAEIQNIYLQSLDKKLPPDQRMSLLNETYQKAKKGVSIVWSSKALRRKPNCIKPPTKLIVPSGIPKSYT